MNRYVPAVLGLVLIALGAVWMLQGVGAVGGSFMSGDPLWAVIGALTAAVGFALRSRSR